MALLAVNALSQIFGKLQALTDFTIQLEMNEIVGVIGPNGAGKTTLFNVLCGIYKPQRGSVYLNEHQLTGLAPDKIARLGLARTFQNIRLFKRLSVLDNVRCVIANTYSLPTALLHNHRLRSSEKSIRLQAQELLALFKLESYAHRLAAELPYGMQRRLEIARALATKPKVLLLDEPSCGMNHSETAAMHDLILSVKNHYQLGILLIDHQMPFVMSLCPKIIVLDFGKIIAEGTPTQIRNNPQVIYSYLGTEC